MFEHLAPSLGDLAYANVKRDGPNDDRNRLFDMHHLKSEGEVKETVLAQHHLVWD